MSSSPKVAWRRGNAPLPLLLCANATLILLAAATSARAGASIGTPRRPAGAHVAEPRRPNERFDIPDSLNVEKSELGLVVGTPGGLNLLAGYWPGPAYGVRASGIYLGRTLGGLQLNLCRTLARGRRSRQVLALVAGTISVEGKSWSYGGVAYDINAGAFFLETGVVGGGGTIDDLAGRHVGVITQIGFAGGGGILGPR